ncbi:MAG TPA: glycosyltransferase family 4 protein [Pyrinomonadaceae bacterium]|nr:glycosyltransferase family 4 protein [Pyrinomonadaceae bacterium]
MRVLHILDSLNRGGTETLALDVCRNARANNLDLTLVATGGGRLEDEFRSSGAEFVRLERRLPVDLDLAARLRRVIEERGARVIHCHQAVEALHALIAARGTRARCVLSFHLLEADAKNRLALRVVVPRAAACVAVSFDLLARLETEAGFATEGHFRVVHNGVDARRLRPVGDARELRRGLGVADDELLYGMVGNFYADGRKDPMTACRALPRFFERVPRARFLFAGARDPAAPQLYDECVRFCTDAKIAERVHFLGARADVPDILAALDAFVLSSRREGFGIAAVEAMMAGAPCLLSDIGPLREVSGEGRHAALFAAGSSEDLARRMTELACDDGLRARLAAGAREWAAREFSIESHIASLKRLYGELAGEVKN